jgi:plasmid stabilization system protein ParE
VPRALRYADSALADLEAIAHWLAQPGSGPAARRRLTSLWASIEQLREYPCLSAIGRHQGVRERPCAGGYRVFYAVHPDTGRNDTAGEVRVLRVFGPGQSRERL